MIDRLKHTKMLQKDGRWPEAVTFKNSRIKFYRGEGMTRTDASDAAWFDLEKKYPPLKPPKARQVGSLLETPIPWSEICEGDDVDAADYWVIQQFGLVYEEAPHDGVEGQLNWEKASSPPPITYAIELMRQAALEESGFFAEFRSRLECFAP